MLWITTWLWGDDKYSTDYAEKLATGVGKNLRQKHKIVVITDRERTIDFVDEVWTIPKADQYLLAKPGCLARLRTFDTRWQEEQGIEPGDRIICLDLDLIITGKLDTLFDHDDDFAILQGVNTVNPNPYNGSVWSLKAGEKGYVWRDFSVEAAENLPHFLYSDDQDWMRARIPNAAAWGAKDGVYAFQKLGWPPGDALPSNARIVAFPGKRDPSQFQHLAWVSKNWRA